jgi:hypothetical protein
VNCPRPGWTCGETRCANLGVCQGAQRAAGMVDTCQQLRPHRGGNDVAGAKVYRTRFRKPGDTPRIGNRIVILWCSRWDWRECGCGGGPLEAGRAKLGDMNSLLAHLLAALLADASAQLAGTPPAQLPSVADRASACGCDAGAGPR